MTSTSAQDQVNDDYSISSTITAFNRPLPLLRRPIPSGTSFILAFDSPNSFFSALRSAHSKLVSQCESGARIGCVLSASARCKPTWWKTVMGSAPSFADRAKCVERETEVCFVAAREKCGDFSKKKCLKGFRDARVVVGEREGGAVICCQGSDLLSSGPVEF